MAGNPVAALRFSHPNDRRFPTTLNSITSDTIPQIHETWINSKTEYRQKKERKNQRKDKLMELGNVVVC